jgi:hypothetical protein
MIHIGKLCEEADSECRHLTDFDLEMTAYLLAATRSSMMAAGGMVIVWIILMFSTD